MAASSAASSVGPGALLPLMTSVIDTGISMLTSFAAGSIQKKYQQQQIVFATTDDYLQNLILKVQSAGLDIVNNGIARPGTPEFEKALQQKLLGDMIYKGNCTADIYVPWTPNTPAGGIRQIMGTFYNNGSVQTNNPGVALTAGPLWSTGCKNSYDEINKEFVVRYKDDIRFQQERVQLSDISKFSLIMKLGLGAFIVVLMIMALGTQKEVIRYQSGF